ncbi:MULTISPECIES: TetR/AcrR family transcriptional regulator [unclassified Modestobacter]|uniref:TetR/AcrR family transcriptional regulator n=1 Tax=unclassified Modestobacter TaxID=2643866 RepID=UPI0022AB0F6C|nr:MULTISPECIES: TetR/AcrR family transcriptional regulator [unclassified Modestobacter]MCZ2827079.1 helix-turn-helix domain containing protein [Modestobacter sp. VKM Ac-2981]MCZ2854330.1 helix-turn-helix domain containing protein [Modestobacter sp. VKM Ac-2982]
MREARARGPGSRWTPEQRRRQILDEATRIVGQRGYYGFSVAAVADACGLTVAGLLHHVGSKDGLLVALLEDRDRRDAAAVAGELGAGLEDLDGSSLAETRTVLRAIVVRNTTQPEIVRLYSMLRTESLFAGHPAHEYFRDRDARVLSTFTRLLTGHVELPGSTARQLLAVMGGLEEQWLRAPDEVDLVREWDHAAARLLP